MPTLVIFSHIKSYLVIFSLSLPDFEAKQSPPSGRSLVPCEIDSARALANTQT